MRSRITGSRPFEKTTVAYESLHATLSSRNTAEMLWQFATAGGQGPEASKLSASVAVTESTSSITPIALAVVISYETHYWTKRKSEMSSRPRRTFPHKTSSLNGP